MFERIGNELFLVVSTALEHGQSLNFVELSELKEEVDRLFSDEQSRILQEELMGNYVCDGCMI